MEAHQKYKTLLLFGAPGCGKGTQGTVLGKIPGYRHVSCGEVFRTLDASMPIGKTFLQYSSRGALVPDDVTVQLWSEYIVRLIRSDVYHPDQELLILDGIPRNTPQVKILNEHIDVVGIIHLSVKGNWDVLAERLQKRALKENRLDDANEETIRHRLQIYRDESKPLLRAYSDDIRYEVNALQSPMEVLSDVLKIIQVIEKFKKI